MIVFFRLSLLGACRFYFDTAFGTVLGTQGTTIVSLGCQWHPSIPLLELCWAPLFAPWDAVWSFRADLAQPECHSTPLGGPLPPIRVATEYIHKQSGASSGSSSSPASRQLCWAPSVPIWCGQVASSKKVHFLDKVLPQAAKLPATSGLFKKSSFLRKSSAPVSEAARDKWLLQKHIF